MKSEAHKKPWGKGKGERAKREKNKKYFRDLAFIKSVPFLKVWGEGI
jgi:hypothetical protein